MTTVRLRSVELKAGCDVTLLSKGQIKSRTSTLWTSDAHGVDIHFEPDRRLLRFTEPDGAIVWVPSENAKSWVADLDAAPTVRLKVQEPEDLVAQRAEIEARVHAALQDASVDGGFKVETPAPKKRGKVKA